FSRTHHMPRREVVVPDGSKEGLSSERTEDRLSRIERENALMRVDMEWEKTRSRFLYRNGSEPPAGTAVFGLVLGLVASVFLFYWGATPGNGWATWIGVVALLIAIAGARYHQRNYASFKHAKDAYQKRRAELMQTDCQ